MHLKPGTYLHQNCFKIVKKIDQGGFGITYLAEEIGWLKSTGFGEQYISNAQPETVVIKELYFDDFCSRKEETGLVYVTNTNKRVEFEKLVNKQLEEGRIIKNLNHQNIVNTRDIFKENDTAYMVLEYVDSVNLEKIISAEGKFSQDKAIEYIEKILSAVEYIHKKKILHLDITPSNILIKKSNNEPVLIDFGASQTYSADNHIASKTSKLVAGFKKHYAPFEQEDIDNLKEFDATFDTYAVGATLYFLLTGTPPPVASYILSGREKLNKASNLNDTVNPQLDKIIFKALSQQYPERYKTATELSNDIEKISVEETKGGISEEDELWIIVNAENEVHSFKRYLIAYPEGRYVNAAKIKVNKLEEGFWGNTNKNNISSLTKYINANPSGKYVVKAKELIKLLTDKKETELVTDHQKVKTQTVTPDKPRKKTYTVYYIVGGIFVVIFSIWLVFGFYHPPPPPPPSQDSNSSMSTDSTVTDSTSTMAPADTMPMDTVNMNTIDTTVADTSSM